ncbi:MAG TPA: hypothetical protein VMN39_07940, partial [Longimicrobiaceae bacterium]|nr:hypothetical protein [Longimicrobiaceae bacterium]
MTQEQERSRAGSGETASGAPEAVSPLEEALGRIERRVVECRACPRLVEWRERVGREKRRAFAADEYWARPIP